MLTYKGEAIPSTEIDDDVEMSEEAPGSEEMVNLKK
jgi:hypothetical protein